MNDVAQAVVVEKKGSPLIWLIPLIALVITCWFGYKSIYDKGPEVTIIFDSGEGIEANKTKIRYKEVDIGLVKKVKLSDDLTKVVVRVQFVKGAEKYLKEKTRFWIVKARVGAGEVSGLDTLLSGVYIGIDPVQEGDRAKRFNGLSKAPVVRSDTQGRHYVLRAQTLGSLDLGASVFFRKIKVGHVVGYELSNDNQHVDIQIFVRAPFHNLIANNTRFWDISGLEMSLDANGFQLSTESATTMFMGGIAFDTPMSLEKDTQAEEYAVFEFYENHKAAKVKRYAKKRYYVLYFNDSVRGLSPGAPVTFRGLELGRVIDVRIEFDPNKLNVRIPVLIEVEPERFNIVSFDTQQAQETLVGMQDVIDALVQKGLRAQLATGNLLTGQLVIDFDFHKDVTLAQIEMSGQYPVLPTVANQFGTMTAGINKAIDKINSLPLDEISQDIRSLMASLNQVASDPEIARVGSTINELLSTIDTLTNNMNQETIPALNTALLNATGTLNSVQAMMGPDAPMETELRRLMVEVAEAARAVKSAADYIERHPESILHGKGSENK